MDMNEAIRQLQRKLEMEMFYGTPSGRHQRLCLLLSKLGVRSAKELLSAGLAFESVQATLKSVTFDDTKLKLWSKVK